MPTQRETEELLCYKCKYKYRFKTIYLKLENATTFTKTGFENICPICGDYSSTMPDGRVRRDKLCKKHGIMEYNKEIEKCTFCGMWKELNSICECQQ